MADAKVDAGSEISAKDLKKKLAEENGEWKGCPC
uniref:Uncharacterized protein n=1 Tax=Anguilla anguilla TaxID=7936 RepID=A0A0E9PNZ8_ANGAN